MKYTEQEWKNFFSGPIWHQLVKEFRNQQEEAHRAARELALNNADSGPIRTILGAAATYDKVIELTPSNIISGLTGGDEDAHDRYNDTD